MLVPIIGLLCAAGLAGSGGPEPQTGLERVPGSVKIRTHTVSETTAITGRALDWCLNHPDCSSVANATLGALYRALGKPVGDAIRALAPVERRSVQDATLYYTDLRLRMDVGDTTMIVRLAPDGSGMDFVFLEKGKLLMVVPLDQIAGGGGGLDLGALRGGSGEVVVNPRCPPGNRCSRAGVRLRKTGETRELLNLPTEHHVLELDANLAPPVNVRTPMLSMSKTTHTWIATRIDTAGVVKAFYRNQAAVMARAEGNPRLATALTAVTAVMTDLGIPLLSTGTDSIRVSATDDEELQNVPIFVHTSTDRILSISTDSLSPSLFQVAGVPPPGRKEACDCSCEGFTKFKELTQRKEEELRKDAAAMRKVMCGRECMMAWVRCGR
jgi:hypothetical protein